jgi:hypothetical protein
MKVNLPIPKFLFFILVFSVAFMIFSSSFFNVLYDDTFIEQQYDELGSTVAEPALKTQEIIAYFNTEADYVNDATPLFADMQFTQEEKEHYKDVKDVIRGVRLWYFISFIIFFVLLIGFLVVLFLEYKEHKNHALFSQKMTLFFIRIQLWLLIICGSILLLLGGFSLFAFRTSFVAMHHLFFETGTWTFSADTLSAALFSQQFFSNFWFAVLKQVSLFLVMLLFLFGLMYTLYTLKKQRKK